jgi:hypothetical protein
MLVIHWLIDAGIAASGLMPGMGADPHHTVTTG